MLQQEEESAKHQLRTLIKETTESLPTPVISRPLIRPEYDEPRLTMFTDWPVYLGRFTTPSSAAIQKTQVEILKALPSYVEVTALYQDENTPQFIKARIPADKFAKINFVQIYRRMGEHWEQDATEGDSRLQFFPLLSSSFAADLQQDYSVRSIVQNTATTFRRTPINFEGGNMCIAKNRDGKSVVFVGASAFLTTQSMFKAAGLELKESEFTSLVRRMYQVEDVRILGLRDDSGNFVRQSRALYHLDRSFMPLRDGVVAVTQIADTSALDSAGSTVNEFIKSKQGSIAAFQSRFGANRLDLSSIRQGKIALHEDGMVAKTTGWRNPLLYDGEMLKALESLEAEFAPLRDDLKRESALALEEMRMITGALKDFDQIPMKASIKSILKDQVPTNMIAFRDPQGKGGTLLVSDFNAVAAERNEPPYENPTYVSENRRRLREMGFFVKPVKDYTFELTGGIHCISNRY